MKITLPVVMLATLTTSAWSQSKPAAPAADKPAAPAAAPDKPAAPAAPSKTLGVGDKAPSFEISDWIKGEKVSTFEPGKIYVMEFWATWCGPCKASMPHISELQEKYADKGVRFIGVSDEKLDTVTKFLGQDEWKAKTRYTLATDPDRSTYNDYMKAAGQNGIPTAFVVGKDGTVEWIGHPMMLDDVMPKVVDGTWDRAAAKKQAEEEKAASAKMMAQRETFMKARAAKDWDTVLKLLDEQAAGSPARQNAVNFQKFLLLITEAERPEQGYAIGEQLMTANSKDAMMLNQIAWTVVDNPNVGKRDFKFALTAAKAANNAADGKNAAVLDTLARCYWETGDKKAAVTTEERAVKALTAEDPDDMAKEIKENLEKYRKESKSE